MNKELPSECDLRFFDTEEFALKEPREQESIIARKSFELSALMLKLLEVYKCAGEEKDQRKLDVTTWKLSRCVLASEECSRRLGRIVNKKLTKTVQRMKGKNE